MPEPIETTEPIGYRGPGIDRLYLTAQTPPGIGIQKTFFQTAEGEEVEGDEITYGAPFEMGEMAFEEG